MLWKRVQFYSDKNFAVSFAGNSHPHFSHTFSKICSLMNIDIFFS